MTILYRPEIIKTVARADALPGGTFIRLSIMSDSWTRLLAPEDRDPHEANDVPFPALVPIEAEEEWTAMGEDHGDPWIAHLGHDGIDGTREEAEAYTRRFGGFLAHRNRTPWEAS